MPNQKTGTNMSKDSWLLNPVFFWGANTNTPKSQNRRYVFYCKTFHLFPSKFQKSDPITDPDAGNNPPQFFALSYIRRVEPHQPILPGVLFEVFAHAAHAVLLASGTLSPGALQVHQLSERRVRFFHLGSEPKLWLCSLRRRLYYCTLPVIQSYHWDSYKIIARMPFDEQK